MKCPKCDGSMVQGFIPDRAHTGSFLMRWHEGRPKQGFWNEMKCRWSRTLPIAAFRCEECGYLELYADPSFKPHQSSWNLTP